MPYTMTKTEAASRKGCAVTTIGNAIERGEINVDEDGRPLDDKTFRRWSKRKPGRDPKPPGEVQSWVMRVGMTAAEKAAFFRKVRKGEDYAAAARRILCG